MPGPRQRGQKRSQAGKGRKKDEAAFSSPSITNPSGQRGPQAHADESEGEDDSDARGAEAP